MHLLFALWNLRYANERCKLRTNDYYQVNAKPQTPNRSIMQNQKQYKIPNHQHFLKVLIHFEDFIAHFLWLKTPTSFSNISTFH